MVLNFDLSSWDANFFKKFAWIAVLLLLACLSVSLCAIQRIFWNNFSCIMVWSSIQLLMLIDCQHGTLLFEV